MKIGFLYAGQGAQHVGMGKDLYDQYIEALAFSKYYSTKDGNQAKHFQDQADGVLRQ